MIGKRIKVLMHPGRIGVIQSEPFYHPEFKSVMVVYALVSSDSSEDGLLFCSEIGYVQLIREEHVLHADQPFLSMEGSDADFERG
jgi:hypothetical protein